MSLIKIVMEIHRHVFVGEVVEKKNIKTHFKRLGLVQKQVLKEIVLTQLSRIKHLHFIAQMQQKLSIF